MNKVNQLNFYYGISIIPTLTYLKYKLYKACENMGICKALITNGDQYCVTKCKSNTTTVTIKFESNDLLFRTHTKLYQKSFRFDYINTCIPIIQYSHTRKINKYTI